MATEKPSPPEGFETFEPSGNDDEDDVQTIDLEPGEVLSGLVLDVTEGENENGPWFRLKIKDESRGIVRYFAKGDAKQACRRGRVSEGEPIWIGKDPEEASFEDSDGEVVKYNPTNVAFPDGED